MSNNIDFTRNLVKGRIAEAIFSQMFRNSGNYTVLEFGYEKIVPELMRQECDINNPTIETLRTAPDFAVINQENKEVRLVEVKYRHKLDPREIKETAIKMHQSWNPSYLFIATLGGFYFDEITRIIDGNGYITPLADIPQDSQFQYLEILQDFEKKN